MKVCILFLNFLVIYGGKLENNYFYINQTYTSKLYIKVILLIKSSFSP